MLQVPGNGTTGTEASHRVDDAMVLDELKRV